MKLRKEGQKMTEQAEKIHLDSFLMNMRKYEKLLNDCWKLSGRELFSSSKA